MLGYRQEFGQLLYTYIILTKIIKMQIENKQSKLYLEPVFICSFSNAMYFSQEHKLLK